MNVPLWVAAALMVCGCASSPDTVYYALAAVRGTTQATSQGAIEVRRPSIAGYLDRAEILGPWDGQRLQLSPSTCWGEPIAAMTGRVLAQDLSDRLHGTIVFQAASGLSIQATTVLELAVWKFDLDLDGYVHLDALASIRSQTGQGEPSPSTRAFALRARPATTAPNGVVGAMSSLLGQLADELAPVLRVRAEQKPSAP